MENDVLRAIENPLHGKRRSQARCAVYRLLLRTAEFVFVQGMAASTL
jgi:hypothetical protein